MLGNARANVVWYAGDVYWERRHDLQAPDPDTVTSTCGRGLQQRRNTNSASGLIACRVRLDDLIGGGPCPITNPNLSQSRAKG